MSNWLNTCCVVLERRPPERLDALDEDDRAENPFWKSKKWALHILNRTFERFSRFLFLNESQTLHFRHGAPTNLPKGSTNDKIDFANFFLREFSGSTTKKKQTEKIFVSIRF